MRVTSLTVLRDYRKCKFMLAAIQQHTAIDNVDLRRTHAKWLYDYASTCSRDHSRLIVRRSDEFSVSVYAGSNISRERDTGI